MAPSALEIIRSVASKYPEAEKAFLFGDHEVYRVRKKVFVWMGEGDSGGIYLGVKLKDSQDAAMMLPFVTPMAYGMAKWGWVNVNFPKGQFSRALAEEWIAESYRHTAPKTLLKQLDSKADSRRSENTASAGPKRTPLKRPSRVKSAG